MWLIFVKSWETCKEKEYMHIYIFVHIAMLINAQKSDQTCINWVDAGLVWIYFTKLIPPAYFSRYLCFSCVVLEKRETGKRWLT